MHYFSSEQAQQVRWLIRDCGQQAKQMAQQGFQVFEKGVNDYVTTVDRALDKRLATGIAELFPNDGIVTEENARSRSVFQQGYRRYWFIDPLDGTEDFIHKRPHYAVMVGLLEAHQPVAGWIYAPAIERFYYGGKDWGLFQVMGDRLPQALVPVEPPLSDRNAMMIGVRDMQQFGAAITDVLPGLRFRSLGSFGLKVMQVVQGYAGLYAYFNCRVKLWDTTGPLALAKAAGLVCCDLDGNPLQFTPESVDPDTLTHNQMIVIGWESHVESMRSQLRQAVRSVLARQSSSLSVK